MKSVRMRPDLDDIDKFCHRMPKCELHAHLNGSIDPKTLEKFSQSISAKDPTFIGLSETERQLLIPRGSPRSMDEVFKLFPIVHRLIQRKDELILATENVISDFAAENVVYLELRSTPKSNRWLSKRDYVEAIVESIKRQESKLGNIAVRLILSIDRRQSLDEAEEIVDMAIEMSASNEAIVVGVELSGDPKFDGRKFLPLFRKAKQASLSTTLHLAELPDCLDELGEFLLFRPDRIGHGTFIHNAAILVRQEKCVDVVLRQKIPIEVCLTSNVTSATTSSFAGSHLNFYLKEGHPVALCTDDRGLMDCSLSGEFAIAARTFGLSKQELFDISVASFKAAFLHKQKGSDVIISRIIELFRNFADKENLVLRC